MRRLQEEILYRAIKESMYRYINLDHRPERKQQFEETWMPLIPEFQRHPAHASPVPHKGSGISHAEAAETIFAADPSHNIAIVFEDDAIPGAGFDISEFRAVVEAASSAWHEFDIVYLCAEMDYRPSLLDGYTVSEHFVALKPNIFIACCIGMIYSRRARASLQKYRDFQLSGGLIPCDRLFAASHWGKYAWSPPFTTWFWKHSTIDQRSSPSDNRDKHTGELRKNLRPWPALTEKRFSVPVGPLHIQYVPVAEKAFVNERLKVLGGGPSFLQKKFGH